MEGEGRKNQGLLKYLVRGITFEYTGVLLLEQSLLKSRGLKSRELFQQGVSSLQSNSQARSPQWFSAGLSFKCDFSPL